MSDTTTEGIRIRVKPSYWEERTSPEKSQFAFSYAVVITNTGSRAATLKRRHWVITDAAGHVEEVKGDGVVGKQPHLEPGESFEYTSYAMLKTPFGSMHGRYFFTRDDGVEFAANIQEFALTPPNALN